MVDREHIEYPSRPASNEQREISGYVEQIWVEQTGERDRVGFTLSECVTGPMSPRVDMDNFVFYLDVGQSVALCQLLVLIDAMEGRWLAKVHYQIRYDKDTPDRHDTIDDMLPAYWIGVDPGDLEIWK